MSKTILVMALVGVSVKVATTLGGTHKIEVNLGVLVLLQDPSEAAKIFFFMSIEGGLSLQQLCLFDWLFSFLVIFKMYR